VRAGELGPSSPALENGLRVVNTHLKGIENRDAMRAAEPIMQDMQGAAKPSASRTVKADAKQLVVIAPVFGSPATSPPLLPPVSVEGGPTQKVINPPKLHGPVPVSAEHNFAPMPDNLHGNQPPTFPLTNGNPARSNDVGNKREAALEIIQ
jgi:hypothetical protein